MQFLISDGVLIPYFHASTNVTLYPDIGSKRKIYKDRQDMIDAEFLEENRSPFSGLWKNLGQILLVILIIANVWWASENMASQREFVETVDSGSFAEILDMAGNSYIKCADVQAENVVLYEKYIKLKEESNGNQTKPDDSSGNVDLR